MPADRYSHQGYCSKQTTAPLLAVVVSIALSSSARAAETGGSWGLDLRLRPPAPLLSSHLSRYGSRGVQPMRLAAATAGEAAAAGDPSPKEGPDLSFDLLEPAAKPMTATVDESSLVLRRKLLTYHQLLGIGLLTCETATVVVGQLNYNDRFGGGPSSARFERAHSILAFTTAGIFVGTGLLALLAPNPLGKKHEGFDRVVLHKIGMFTAVAGMAAEVGLGLYTTRREGYLDQPSLAKTHLAIGYVTLAATYLGVGSIVF